MTMPKTNDPNPQLDLFARTPVAPATATVLVFPSAKRVADIEAEKLAERADKMAKRLNRRLRDKGASGLRSG